MRRSTEGTPIRTAAPRAHAIMMKAVTSAVVMAVATVVWIAHAETPARAAVDGPKADHKHDGPKAGPKPGPKPKPEKLGLLKNDPGAYQGYTLIAPLFSKSVYLIDMNGKVVHAWETGHRPGANTFLLENGHLLRSGDIQPPPPGFGPGAGGHVLEIDWDGKVVWDFKYANDRHIAHHDFHKMPNGNVLMLAWEKKSAEEAIARGRRPGSVGKSGLCPDYIVEVKPTGKTTGEIVWEWHIWDHLVQDHDSSKPDYGDVSDHPELIDINFGAGEGPIAPLMATKDGQAKLRSLGYLGGGTPAPDDAKKDTKDDKDKDRNAKQGDDAKKEKKDTKDDKDKNAKKDKGKDKPNRPSGSDWTHCNAVSYNPELDQVIVSVHAFSEFWIIDHSTTKAEAAGHKGGRSGRGGDLLYRWGNPRAYRSGAKMEQRLFNQHNAHWISPGLPGAGRILVFNNGSGRPGGNSSSVDEVVPPRVDARGQYRRGRRGPYGPAKADWSYSAPKKSDFYSFFISGAQRLSNGNTLICSGANGIVFEVAPDKTVVWKYANPVMGQPGGPGMPGGPGDVDLLPFFVRDQLDLSPEQRKQLDEIQKAIGERLSKALSAPQLKQLRSVNPFGPDGFAMMPPPGRLVSPKMRTALKLNDEQAGALDRLQKEVDAKLDGLLDAGQKKSFQKMMEDLASGKFFGPGGPLPFFGPGGPPPGADAKGKSDKPGADAKGKSDKPGGPPPGGPGGPMRGNTLFRAYRYGPDFPGLAGKTLTPGKSLEEIAAIEKAKSSKAPKGGGAKADKKPVPAAK